MGAPDGVEVFESLLREKGLIFPFRWFLRLADAVYGRVSKPGAEEESVLATLVISGIIVGFVAGVVVAAATVFMFWASFPAGC